MFQNWMEHLETARHALYVPNSLFNKQKWKGSERLETSRPLSGGGEEEDRTPDLCIANAALSQLSYVPIDSIIARLEKNTS